MSTAVTNWLKAKFTSVTSSADCCCCKPPGLIGLQVVGEETCSHLRVTVVDLAWIRTDTVDPLAVL